MSEHIVPTTQKDEFVINPEHNLEISPVSGKDQPLSIHLEQVGSNNQNFHYDKVDDEPEFHARTWLALAAMLLLNMVQVVALVGPPAVVCGFEFFLEEYD